MSYLKPPESRKSVSKASKRVREKNHDKGDIAVIDQWRASHGYVLNTFQVLLRKQINQNDSIQLVQRLKRRNTILDKLQRVKSDGTPLIRDTLSMHDIAGFRLIFDDIDSLYKFRKDMNQRIEKMTHKVRNDIDKYDYIKSPKDTGYRGIHDVWSHHPRPHRRDEAEKNKPWHGLVAEIQYRTQIQNSWATAVEIADLIDKTRTKFNLQQDDRGQFFALCSEYIARKHERLNRSFLSMSTEDIHDKMKSLNANLQIVERLKAVKVMQDIPNLKGKHFVLTIKDDDARLEVRSYTRSQDAVFYSNEEEEKGNNSVYVSSKRPDQLPVAYKNYFTDSNDFIQMIDM